jgi:hypothetical protein
MIIVTGPGSPVLSTAAIESIIQRWRNGGVIALPAEIQVEFLDQDSPALSHWTPNLIDCLELACVDYPIREVTP